MIKKLNKIFENSKRICIDNNTKIVIMSDCHRGAKNDYDNFMKNENIFKSALNYYYSKGFIYIELGDGDDMWEVKNCKDIVGVYLDIFKQIRKFYKSGRLIMIYGNHDITKKYPSVLQDCFYEHYNKITNQNEKLLDNLIVYESLILNYNGNDIFLVHGHQVDFLNGTIWKFSRFLVQHLWRMLEYIGIKDPTGNAKKYFVQKNTEKKLEEWSKKNNKILIAGHTHRPIFPKAGESLYFNDGSCIHPDGITCLEIYDGTIALVKWMYKINKGELILVKRVVLEKEYINNFYE